MREENCDQIIIEELSVEMSIGIYDHEKSNTQRVIIDVVINVENNNKKVENIKDVISYEDIVNEIIALSQKKHYELVETFAEEISAISLKPMAHSCIVTIRKPDIIEAAKSVGVSIFRKSKS